MLLHGPTYPSIIIATQVTLLALNYKEAGEKTAGDYLFPGASANYCIKARISDEVVTPVVDMGKAVFDANIPPPD